MSSLTLLLSFYVLLIVCYSKTHALNSDGSLLLSFKYAVLDDPLSVLDDWNYDDSTPCAWNGVMCTGFSAAGNGSAETTSRVIGLVLPSSKLLGSVPPELALIEHLRHLDLSGNFLNGTLPASLFNASELHIVSLSNNDISGEIPELSSAIATNSQLQMLNLSDNALNGKIPDKLSLIPNLTTVLLSNNYLSGELPGGIFHNVEVIDLSSNLINGSLPADLTGGRLKYLNLSYNKLTGAIPQHFGSGVPPNATVDLSFNNLTGAIPETSSLLVSQKPKSFAGNPDLCGEPLKNLCPIPSSLSNPPPNVTSGSSASGGGADSPPAFAAIPRNESEGQSPSESPAASGLRPAVIAAIIVGDLVGLGLLFMVFLYVYQAKKKKQLQHQRQNHSTIKGNAAVTKDQWLAAPATASTSGIPWIFSWCKRNNTGGGSDDSEDTSYTTSSEAEADDARENNPAAAAGSASGLTQGAILVMVDNEVELELEALLKASAYILGATGSSIVYKAVLADGTALAVRRIGESSSAAEKLKDFEAQVRSIAKFRHPNLLRIRGFYWGADEKLLITDYASNGSLGNITFTKKVGSSPYHISWETRLRIARGVARCLAYLHDKKFVHGNIKPNNILLDADFEPLVGDFCLDRLVSGADLAGKPGASSRLFGSKRSTHSQSSIPDLTNSLSPSPTSSSLSLAVSPYLAPESLKNIKPNYKWDVYSFGVVLLELMAGRVFSEAELSQWNAGFVVEDKIIVLRMADPTLRGEAEGKEEILLALFKLGFSCASMAPQKRPSMKDVLQNIEKITTSSSSSSSAMAAAASTSQS